MQLQQVGLQHPRIKQVRSVLRNSSPNHRRLLVAEGLWAHNVLLDLAVPIDLFLWCPEAAYASEAHQRSRQLAAQAACSYRISSRVLEHLTERDRPDGLVSLVRLPAWDAETVALGRQALVLVADAIEIPGNLGTLVRSLDGSGGTGLLLTNRRTRLTHPKVFRGSRGMNLRMPIIEFGDVDEAVRWLRRHRFTVYLVTTGPEAVPYRTVAYPNRTALVVGNERHGISSPWRQYDFTEVAVPMLGGADSLNVAVCAAIMLYEARAHASGW
jgi:tRNA G18 (ribose-2'-O)-methylase SpoU